MRTSRRVVFDSNVLVSAFLFPNSVPGRLVFSPRTKIVPLISADLQAELASVLSRAKLDSYIGLDRRIALLAAYSSRCERIEIVASIQACRDPRDDHILELAVSGQADSIITGDGDLLALHPFRGIQILRPADFALTQD